VWRLVDVCVCEYRGGVCISENVCQCLLLSVCVGVPVCGGHIYLYTYIHIHMYIYIQREREREVRQKEIETERIRHTFIHTLSHTCYLNNATVCAYVRVPKSVSDVCGCAFLRTCVCECVQVYV